MIYFIILIGLMLRLINIDQSLWFDEAISVLAAKDLGFWHFVTGYPIGDFHPPGYFALLWVWGHIFGFSELAVRLPSVLLGIATIWITYLIGKDFFSKQTAIFSAFFMAINPLHVYYSQEARMYSLSAFGVALSFFALINLLKYKKFLWLYIFSLVLILLSDYVAYVAIPTQLLYVIIYYRKNLKQVFLSQLAASIIFSPWMLIFPSQLASGQVTAANVPGWAQVVGGSSLKNLILIYVKLIIGRISIADKTIYTVVIFLLGSFYLILIANLFKKIDKEKLLILFWVFMPTIVVFLISFLIPALSYFRMLFIAPGFCLMLALAISGFNPRLQRVFSVATIFISLICLFFYYTNPVFQRENWKNLQSYFESTTSNSLILFENNDIPAPFLYYQLSTNYKNIYQGGLKNFPAENIDDVVDLDPRSNSIYLVDYLVEISDPNRTIDQKLTVMGYKVIRTIDIPSLGLIYEYIKSD